MSNLQLLGTHFHQVGDLLLNWNLAERMPTGSGGGSVVTGIASGASRNRARGARGGTRTRSRSKASLTNAAVTVGGPRR